ncbi:MAG: hypothetical protein AB1568_06545 [Thermodesulfobacteriota bacterium]
MERIHGRRRLRALGWGGGRYGQGSLAGVRATISASAPREGRLARLAPRQKQSAEHGRGKEKYKKQSTHAFTATGGRTTP